MRDLNLFSGFVTDLTINGAVNWLEKNIVNIGVLSSAVMRAPTDDVDDDSIFKGHNGESWVTLARIVNTATPVFEIAAGKLTGNLNCNSKDFLLLNKLEFDAEGCIRTMMEDNSNIVFYAKTVTVPTEIARMSSGDPPSFDLKLGKLTGNLNCNSKELINARIGSGSLLLNTLNCNLQKLANMDLGPGDTSVLTSANGYSTGSVTYVKMREITIDRGGTYRLKYGAKTNNGSYAWSSLVKINGTLFGNDPSETGVNTSFETKTINITTIMNPGDTLELWLKIANATTTAQMENMCLYWDLYDNKPTFTHP